uniref:Uncharacterized protein n=1 Tax=Panagrellus redivivus TaxID=6233 RepID=A0A7E4W140_PANRE
MLKMALAVESGRRWTGFMTWTPNTITSQNLSPNGDVPDTHIMTDRNTTTYGGDSSEAQKLKPQSKFTTFETQKIPIQISSTHLTTQKAPVAPFKWFLIRPSSTRIAIAFDHESEWDPVDWRPFWPHRRIMGPPSKKRNASKRSARSARRKPVNPANSIDCTLSSAMEELSAKDAVPRATLPAAAPVPEVIGPPKARTAMISTATSPSITAESPKGEPFRKVYVPLVLIEPVGASEKTEVHTKGKPGCCLDLDYEAYTKLHLKIIESLISSYHEEAVTPPSPVLKVTSNPKK